MNRSEYLSRGSVKYVCFIFIIYGAYEPMITAERPQLP